MKPHSKQVLQLPVQSNTINNTGEQLLDDVWLDKQNILQFMHISAGTLQNWRKKGVLPFAKIGGKIYYKLSDLQKLLNEAYAENERRKV